MVLAGALVAIAAGPSARDKAHMESTRAYEGLTTYEIEMRNTSPFAAILGEVRTSSADLMYIKTERYIHAGVGYTPHLSAEEMARSGKAISAAPSAISNAPSNPTSIPPRCTWPTPAERKSSPGSAS